MNKETIYSKENNNIDELAKLVNISTELLTKMMDQAESVKSKSYSPYSKFRVAAVLVTDSGNIYKGCNVENASYGMTLCAERVAATAAVTAGEKKFGQIFLITDSAKPEFPCGACLQFLAEFNPELKINAYARDGRKKSAKLSDILKSKFRFR